MELARLKIALVSSYNAADPDAMSGIPYHIWKALSACYGHIDIISVPRTRLQSIAIQILKLVNYIPGFANYDSTSNTFICKLRGDIVSRSISEGRYDLVVCVYAHALCAHLNVPCPIVYISDSTYQLNLLHYAYAKQQARISQKNNDRLEQRAITKASFLLYPSPWAARSALKDYGADPTKIHITPFGANLEPVPTIIDSCLQRPTNRCQLLFVGRDWERKGGPIAVDTLNLLLKMGIDAHLTICGCDPPGISSLSVTVIPSISRNEPDEVERLKRLFANSHFLLLPTRAEAFGIVFAEASAFALPSIATDIGGVGGAIESGANGYLLPPTASAQEYSDLIAHLWRDTAGYNGLSKSARRYYEAHLKWSVWAETLLKIVNGDKGTLHDGISPTPAAQEGWLH